MRIVIVNHEYPPLGGGAATATEQLSRALTGLGHEVLVVTSSGPGLPSRESEGGVSVRRLPTGRRSRFAPSAAELLRFCIAARLYLPASLREFRAEAVLAFFAVPSGWIALRCARRLGLPVVVSVRGSDVPGFSSQRLGGSCGWAARPFICTTLRSADHVVPNCERLAQLVLRMLPELAGRMTIIPNGVEPQRIARQPASSGSGELRLVTVGQLIPRKGIARACEALRLLLDQGLAARLTVIGDGPLADELHTRTVDLRIADRVTFAGYQSRDEIADALRQHDLFVMPSQSEGMSNAVLEAMAAGLPVVTTENGSHDVVRAAGCGEVTPVDDAAALAAAVQRIAGDPASRVRLAEAALAYARLQTWNASAAAFSNLLISCRARRDAAGSQPSQTRNRPLDGGCPAPCAE